MNDSKKLLIGASVILTVVAAGYGVSSINNKKKEEAEAAKQVEARKSMGGPQFNPMQLMADLNLTEEQRKKLEAGQKEMQGEFKKMQSLSQEERMKAMPGMMQKRMQALSSILTPEQQAKLKEKMPPMMGGRGPGGFPGGMPPMPGGGPL